MKDTLKLNHISCHIFNPPKKPHTWSWLTYVRKTQLWSCCTSWSLLCKREPSGSCVLLCPQSVTRCIHSLVQKWLSQKKSQLSQTPHRRPPHPSRKTPKLIKRIIRFRPLTVEKWFRQRHLYLNFRVCCCSKQQGVYVAILRWQLVKHNNTPKAPRFHSAVGASNNLQKRGFASPAHLGNHFPANNIPADQILNRSEKEKKGRTVVSRQPESI